MFHVNFAASFAHFAVQRIAREKIENDSRRPDSVAGRNDEHDSMRVAISQWNNIQFAIFDRLN